MKTDFRYGLIAIVIILVIGLAFYQSRTLSSEEKDRMHENLMVIWSYIEDEGEYTRQEAREAFQYVEKCFDDLT